MGMHLGIEVAMVMGIAVMGIIALPWSAGELASTRRAVGEAARGVVRGLLGRTAEGKPAGLEWSEGSLVPGGSELSVVPAPVRLRRSA